jgi:nickel-dependent lactate racemase
MVKKLGEEVVSRYRVYNHNAFGNCTYVGTTATYKTKVYINEEYMKCDLKIVIGSCVPHGVAGFGGGAKMIMPGLASFDTVNHHHGTGGAGMNPTYADQNPPREWGLSITTFSERTLTKQPNWPASIS